MGRGNLERETWCVVVEGEKREFQYFSQAAIEFNNIERLRERKASVHSEPLLGPTRTLSVRPAAGGSVAQILARGEREAKNFDKTFVVLDGDVLNMNDIHVLEKAVSAGIRVYLSRPCFEIWILLHFENNIAPETNCQPLKEKLKQLWPHFERRPTRDWERLRANLDKAKERSHAFRKHRPDKQGTTEVDLFMNLLGF
jgi:hypothetical protein